MSSFGDVKKLFGQMFPTGRAFQIPKGGNREKFHDAQAIGEAQAVDDAASTLWSILPDNPFFTVDDATDWERRLGMITNPSVPLDDRKAAIIRKMNHPGDIPARQSVDYIQQSLQLAGFDVYVYENDPPQSPQNFLVPQTNTAQFGQRQFGQFNFGNAITTYPNFFTYFQWGTFQFGQAQWGGVYFNNVIVNSVDESVDFGFNIGTNYRRTFIVGGDPFGTFANVDINRKDEFRQLILRLKPVQNLGYLLINYV